MKSDQLLMLASFLHHRGAQRTLLTAEQRKALLAVCDGAAVTTPATSEWARIVYSSEGSLQRAYDLLVAFRPELLRNATRDGEGSGTGGNGRKR